MRDERIINGNWGFLKLAFGTEINDMYASADEAWQSVTLPHDWLIYDTENLYEDATGWYRKYIGIVKEEGRRYLLNFDGVYMDSTVYVNGTAAGSNPYGYNAFEFDITELLKDGENEIVVQVRHKSPNTRWYSGAGIFRDVTFKNVPDTHIATDGVYVSAKKIAGRWVVIADTEIEGPEADRVELVHSIRLKPTNPAFTGTISKACPEAEGFVVDDSAHGDNCSACGHPCPSRETVRVSEYEVNGRSATLIIDNPYVWDITAPNLYDLRTAIMLDGEEIDSVSTIFGLREAEFTADRGFILNGRRVKLYGTCEHHDLGCLGAAFDRDAMCREFMILKSMGVNAVRTSHNMPAKGLMELADEMGILIDSEAFDMWLRPKTTYDYARFFDEDCERAVRSWVRRDRNHPSVIMWSIGNEIYDCHGDATAPLLTARLKKYVEDNDYLHNAPVTHGSNYMPWEGAQNCTDVLKLAGYNYGEKLYDKHHEEHPDWKIYGSETSSTVQSRGIYHFPMNVSVMADDDDQCSGLGNCTTSWGAENVEYVIKADRDRDYSAGQFIWSGFDYIGEPTPYHTKNSYFGQIDTAGFPKDTYYIFKAEWTDVKKAPFVHVFPYWDFNEGQLVDVRIASNAPEVELIVNGVSAGRKSIDHAHGDVLCPTWQVKYHKGYIEGIAYDGEGNVIARERRNSFSDAAELKYRRAGFEGTGANLAFFEIYAADADGNEVENADCRVNVGVKNGTLQGLDNGDSTDFEQYKCNSRRMFVGKLLAVVKPDRGFDPEDVELVLTSPEITGKEDLNGNGEGFYNCLTGAETIGNESNVYGIDTSTDIPIRKLELSISGDKNTIKEADRDETAEAAKPAFIFTPDCCSIEVEARICPASATYDDVIWQVVNDYAVPSNLAEVVSAEDEIGAESGTEKGSGTEPKNDVSDTERIRRATITAKGDGSFRLRCMTKNGTDKMKCISVLEFAAEGLGTAYLNPYEFIAGSLYTDSKGDVGNGNEKGVATPRGEESYVGYENIDFGEFGSDEVTLPIFTLDGNEYVLQIWEGRPGDAGSELLCDGRYQKPSIWNVYQPETYKLKRRVKGITSIYFTANAKYHLKGFCFTKPDKAFETVYATENSRIYGDTYEVTGDAVIGIGNNVTLEFDGMDFGEGHANRLVICGNSPIENNSVHLIATDTKTGENTKYLLEFTHSEGYTERVFELPEITGSRKIGFVFLPGSNFDFKWFRFEA